MGSVVFLAWIGGSVMEAAPQAPVPGDLVRVVLRNGSQRDFPPAADTNAARGAALVEAVAYVNDLARGAAEEGCVFRGALVQHSDGNFYGTTPVGGRNDQIGRAHV